MPNEYLLISDEVRGPNWLLQIMRRLNESSSALLRSRMQDWPDGPLLERGLALATKLMMLARIARRINLHIQRVRDELTDEQSVNEHIRRGFAFRLTEQTLPYDILIDIESFIFESRSAYEIIGRFLDNFFSHILDQSITQDELIEMLDGRDIDTQWITELSNDRNLFIHETAPWLAVKIASREPLEIELVILKENIQDFANPEDYIEFDQLRNIYQGFESSLRAIREFIFEKIRQFEQSASN